MSRPAPPDELDRILRMGTPGSWALYALFAITHATLAVTAGGPPMSSPWGWFGLVAVLAGGAWSVWPGPYPMPVGWGIAILVLILSGTNAVTWQLDPTSWPGYSSWNLGAVAFICFALSMRGRTVLGWIGVLGQTVSTVLWSLVLVGDAWPGFALSYRHLGTYLAGSLLAIGIHSTARRIAEYREAERRAVADTAALEAGRTERAAELKAVREIAGPSLRTIADGEPADPVEFRRIEAQLRDRIRARRLAQPPLSDAIDDARRRGIDVDVLDDFDRGDIDDGELRAALAATADLLAGWRGSDGPVTVRLAGRDPAITVASQTRPAGVVPVGEAR